MSVSELGNPLSMGEDLSRQAALAARMVPIHCSECAEYHLDWATCRKATDLSSELLVNAELIASIFFAISKVSAKGSRKLRFFIAGSADAKLLASCAFAAHTQTSFSPSDVTFQVMDQCRTPLTLCEDFAERHQLALTVSLGRISEEVPEQRVDIVIVSGLLRFIPKARHLEVVKKLKLLLDAGGLIVFTQSLRAPGSSNGDDFEYSDPKPLIDLFSAAGLITIREATTRLRIAEGTLERRVRERLVLVAT